MTERETRRCEDVYREWLTTASHGVSLEEGSFYGQIDLANVCMLAGEEEAGFRAAEKAVQIAPSHPQGYQAVLIMCFPQWYDQPEVAASALRAAAKVAHSSEWWLPEDRVGVATQGAACGQIPFARTIVKDAREKAGLEAWIQEEERLQEAARQRETDGTK